MDERTVVIVDLAHHGTTMVSGLCCILGIPMCGGRFDAEKLEDLDIQDALLKHRRQAFERLVEERNAAQAMWGFKRVGGWLWASWLETLRNPVYFAIYKDPVSVTRRRVRKLGINKLLNTAVQMERSVRGIRDAKLPVHLLSYQAAIVTPERFVREIAQRIGVDVADEQMDRAVGYIQPNTGSSQRRYPEIAPWI